MLIKRERIGDEYFFKDIAYYYSITLSEIIRPIIENNQEEILIEKNKVRYPHYFSAVTEEYQSMLHDLEISLDDFYSLFPKESIQELKKIVKENQIKGDFRIFSFINFPQWKDVATVFRNKYPIIDLKLKILISTSKKYGHFAWESFLYNSQHHDEKNITEKDPAGKFISTSQGFVCSSGDNQKVWYISPKLSEDLKINQFLMGEKNIKILFGDTNRFDLNIK